MYGQRHALSRCHEASADQPRVASQTSAPECRCTSWRPASGFRLTEDERPICRTCKSSSDPADTTFFQPLTMRWPAVGSSVASSPSKTIEDRIDRLNPISASRCSARRSIRQIQARPCRGTLASAIRNSESCVLDLSAIGTKAAERRFMLAFLTAERSLPIKRMMTQSSRGYTQAATKQWLRRPSTRSISTTLSMT
jgi:hypothetical protein